MNKAYTYSLKRNRVQEKRIRRNGKSTIMNYKHESRKLTGFYLAAIGFALILWAILQALN